MEDTTGDLVEPIHADSFFSVAKNGEIHERLSFEYLDPDGYYREVTRDPDLLGKEILKLSTNMQHFLDSERVEINGVRVRSIVNYTDIFLKGASDVVAVVYIIDFAGKFDIGKNTIETWLEEEDAPYDFEIIWRFPVGTKVTEIDTKLEFEIYQDLVALWALEGDFVGGYEKMEFILPNNLLTQLTKRRVVSILIQLNPSLTQIAIIFIICGVLLLLIGIGSMVMSQRNDPNTSVQSKGIILLGPIPIIWGYGRRVQFGLIVGGLLFILIWLILVSG